MLLTRDLDTALDDLGERTVIIEAVFLFLATVSLCLRLWGRKISQRSLCLNDYFVMIAWPFAVGLFATAVIAVIDEKPVENLADPVVQSSFKSTLASDYLWATTITFIKISILHLYITLFPQRAFRLLSYFIMGVVVSFGVAVIFTRSFLCTNISMQWNFNMPNQCGSNWAAVLAESVINAIINTVIICMPMPILWRLKTGLKQKVYLTIVFGVGSITVFITILRFISVAQETSNWQSALARVALWTNQEALMGIICACLPVMPPALGRIFYLTTGRIALQSSSKPTPVIPSTVARIRQKGWAGNQSRGITEDQYPLTEGRSWRDSEHRTSAQASVASKGGYKRETIRDGVTELPEDHIRVQRDWSVVTE